MTRQLNCPNCGAPIDGDKCPYCGTTFINTLSFDLENVQYLKVRIGDKIVLTKVYLASMTVNYENAPIFVGRDECGRVLSFHDRPFARFNLEFVQCGPM